MCRIFKINRTLLYILLCCLLNGCGFHLRGTTPSSTKTIYIDSQQPYSTFTKQLKNHLRTSHIKIVDYAKQAPITLVILDEQFTMRQISIGNSQKMQNHIVAYSVTYAVQSFKDQSIIAPTTIHVQRQITTLPNEELMTSYKLVEAKQTMMEDIVMKILFHLSTNITKNRH